MSRSTAVLARACGTGAESGGEVQLGGAARRLVPIYRELVKPLFLIEAPDGSYRLTTYDPGFEKKMANADDIISRYRNTLHVLSK